MLTFPIASKQRPHMKPIEIETEAISADHHIWRRSGMLSTRHWLVTTILFAVLGVSTNGGTAMGQDVFNGDGVAGTAPDDPDNPSTPPALIPLDGNGGGNWEGSYPGNGSQELDEGISIELNEEDEEVDLLKSPYQDRFYDPTPRPSPTASIRVCTTT